MKGHFKNTFVPHTDANILALLPTKDFSCLLNLSKEKLIYIYAANFAIL